jgi:hypothetical protein
MVLKVNLDSSKLQMNIQVPANLEANYAGMAYLNTAKYTEAIDIKQVQIGRCCFGCFGKGAIGDAYAQNKQPEEALDNYLKAGGK